jgi:hypothetical protein
MDEVMDQVMDQVMQEVQVMASGEERIQGQSGTRSCLAPVAALPLQLSGRKGSGSHGCTAVVSRMRPHRGCHHPFQA